MGKNLDPIINAVVHDPLLFVFGMVCFLGITGLICLLAAFAVKNGMTIYLGVWSENKQLGLKTELPLSGQAMIGRKGGEMRGIRAAEARASMPPEPKPARKRGRPRKNPLPETTTE